MDVDAPTPDSKIAPSALAAAFSWLSSVLRSDEKALRTAAEVLGVLPSLDETAWEKGEAFRLFSLELPPREGFLLDEDAEMHAGRLMLLKKWYGQQAFPLESIAEEADHFAVAFAFLAQSIDRPAWQEPTLVLIDRLAVPLPLWSAALARHPGQAGALGEFAATLVAHCAAERSSPRAASEPPSTPGRWWEDASTNLRQIAEFLATPGRSGWIVERERLTRIARALDVPRGFGSRIDMLETLVREAGQGGKGPQLVALLLDDLEELAVSTLEFAWDAAPCAQHWQPRWQQTRSILGMMREEPPS